ncbi:MAG: LysR family transcriptional regulator [Rhizobiaceae bacterium]|nr:LysR family transcriptional regulator [Rhizobiaceae bacterium]
MKKQDAGVPGQRRLPSYALLRSFECAARHESFTLAAEELHLTQSAVSRQVKELEEFLGFALFRRAGRRVVLTEAGQRFAAHLAHDLENLKQTVIRAIAAGSSGSVLRLAVLPTFASRWLIPRLESFYVRHPEIEISITTRTVPFDLEKERFDAAIHFGDTDWPGARMNRLFDENMIAVASPDYVERHAAMNPQRLMSAPLLHLVSRERAWSDWFALHDLASDTILRGKRFDQFSMIIAAAAASHGAALLPSYLVEKEIQSGELVQLSDRQLSTANSYYIVSAAGDSSPDVATFTRWLMATAAKAA